MMDYLRRLGAAIIELWGSRAFLAVSALCFVAFFAHTQSAPGRLPPFGGWNLLALGIAPPLPTPEIMPEIREQAEQAARAAKPYLLDGIREFFDANPQAVAIANMAGLILSGIALVVAFILSSRRPAAYRDA